MRAAAFSVHIFTALGAGIALIALLEAVREHWAAMFGWLGRRLIVDALDGPIARRLDVARVQPNWSGDVLDLVVDFVTYVFVPAYAITASGLLLPADRADFGRGRCCFRRAIFRRSANEGARIIIFAASLRCGMRRHSTCSCCICRPCFRPCRRHSDSADVRAVSRTASDTRCSLCVPHALVDCRLGGAGDRSPWSSDFDVSLPRDRGYVCNRRLYHRTPMS